MKMMRKPTRCSPLEESARVEKYGPKLDFYFVFFFLFLFAIVFMVLDG